MTENTPLLANSPSTSRDIEEGTGVPIATRDRANLHVDRDQHRVPMMAHRPANRYREADPVCMYYEPCSVDFFLEILACEPIFLPIHFLICLYDPISGPMVHLPVAGSMKFADDAYGDVVFYFYFIWLVLFFAASLYLTCTAGPHGDSRRMPQSEKILKWWVAAFCYVPPLYFWCFFSFPMKLWLLFFTIGYACLECVATVIYWTRLSSKWVTLLQVFTVLAAIVLGVFVASPQDGCTLVCDDYFREYQLNRCNEIPLLEYVYKKNCTLLIGIKRK